MKNKILQLTAILLLTGPVTVWAIPIVSVDVDPTTPGIQTSIIVSPSTSFAVDIVIAGVDSTAPLNGFEFDLSFDPSILTATSVADGGFLLPPVFVVQSIIGAMIVEFAEVSLLPAGASGAGVLATIMFDAIDPGTSALDLNNVLLTAPFGLEIPTESVNDGSVTVQGATAVPEPGTLLLFGSGLLLLIGRRRAA